jgi:putative ABC transport system permease protein
MSSLLQDLRFGIRVLLKTPGFSAAAVLVLAAAIGVNTAVFGFVNAFVLKPLPGREKPGEVVGVYCRDRVHPDTYRDFSYPAYVDVRDRAGAFSGVTAFSVMFAGIREGDVTRRTLVSAVTSTYFSTLGVGLAAGRVFSVDEERPGSRATVAIVSHDLWKRRGSDPRILGTTLTLNAVPFTIVGVAPRGFTGTTAALAPEAWVPTGAWETVAVGAPAGPTDIPLADRRADALMLVGRLKPGLSIAAAAPAMSALASTLEREYPAENRDQELLVAPLSRLTMSSRPQSDAGSMGYSALVVVIASLVLLVAGMNLANMVLARGTSRQKEIGMRLALGGSRGRIVRQLLTEGFVLSLAGGAGGLLVSYWASRLLWSSLAARMPVPMQFDPAPDARVLAVTLGFCVLSTVVFGLGPAWRLSRTDIVSQVKSQAGQSAAGSDRRWSARNVLVAAQFALSLGLLTTAGLFVRGAINVSSSDPGYRFEDRAVVTLDAGLSGYDEARARAGYRRVLERLRGLPQVESAAAASLIAFDPIEERQAVRPGGGRVEGASVPAVVTVVGASFFQTLSLQILRGRDFSPGEEAESGGPRVAIVDQPLAHLLFGGDDPVGRTLSMEGQPAPLLVVGLAPGLRQSVWDKAPVAHVYLPSGQVYRATTHVHLHFRRGTPAAEALEAVRREVRAADERLPLMAINTMAEHRDGTSTYWAVGMMARIFATFGALALFLAIVGIYSVKAYVVARRTREIGIRMALGSTPGQVVQMVVREGMGLTAAGMGVGLLLGLGIGRLVSALLYDVSPFDLTVFTATPLVLAIAVVAACYLPARRATRIAPLAALRTE